MRDTQIGITGSAATEGTTRTGGGPGAAGIMASASPAVRRTMVIWGIAVAVLVVFHVGGAKLG